MAIGLALLLTPAPALAVQSTGPATPEKLWKTYPLRPRTGAATPTVVSPPARTGAATPTVVSPPAHTPGSASPTASTPRPRDTASSSGSAPLPWLALLAAAVALGGVLVAGRRRRRRPPAPAAVAPRGPAHELPPASGLAGAPAPDAPDRVLAPRSYPPPARPAPPSPPLPPARAARGADPARIAVNDEVSWRATTASAPRVRIGTPPDTGGRK